MTRGRALRVVLATMALGVVTLLWLGVSARAWGNWTGLLAHPARRGVIVASLGLTLLAALSPFSMSTGRRADLGELWIMPVGVAVVLLLAWLPPWCDRRDRWVVDGDAVRWLGLGLFVAGGVLRVWPIFVLGRRFSGFVAIQEGHRLVTHGPYRWIRNPSYLGLLVNAAGWSLVFRSVAGLLFVLAVARLLLARMSAEEALLASEFGAEYEAYRRRTWRLLPGVY